MLVSIESHFRNASQYRLQDKPKMGYVGRAVARFERECESDQEEEVMLRRPRTRKRSNTSWNINNINILVLRWTRGMFAVSKRTQAELFLASVLSECGLFVFMEMLLLFVSLSVNMYNIEIKHLFMLFKAVYKCINVHNGTRKSLLDILQV